MDLLALALPSLDFLLKVPILCELITKCFKVTFKGLHNLAPAYLLTVISCHMPYASAFLFSWKFL